jgi:hypothetical protein
MRKMILLSALIAAALPVFAQTGSGRQRIDFFGGDGYNDTSPTLRFAVEGTALKVSGTASDAKGGGYVIDVKENLVPNSAKQLILKVSGIGGTDKFDAFKLLKLELNNAPQTTVTDTMRNRNDRTYINARNGEAVFDISRLQNIRKINLVFFNCTVADLKIEAFYE